MMTQRTGLVGLDVAKSKADACIRSVGLRLSAPSTPEGEAQLVVGPLWQAGQELAGDPPHTRACGSIRIELGGRARLA